MINFGRTMSTELSVATFGMVMSCMLGAHAIRQSLYVEPGHKLHFMSMYAQSFKK
ncbi:MAG TPA: hypothetical protein VF172_14010 [Nitrososphaera sp.]|jgi:hypothetical protein